jgi:ketosteroid isomerase-like protein
MVPEDHSWLPLTRADLIELERDRQLRDRRGRVWTVHVASHERGDALTHVVLRAGDHIRHVDERFAEDCALVAETDAGAE